MTAWLELEDSPPRPSPPQLSPGLVTWERMLLRQGRVMAFSIYSSPVGPRPAPLAALPAVLLPSQQVRFDVSPEGERWWLRPHVADLHRNGVRLVSGERYPLENGDLIEALPGSFLRFLDDTLPSPLPRLRRAGDAFLFAPWPPDDPQRWRALRDGSDELLVALQIIRGGLDDDAFCAAFPQARAVVPSAAGPYALLPDAGISLKHLIWRTKEQGAVLDPAWGVALARGVRAATANAFAHGFPSVTVHMNQVFVTWDGRAVWWGFEAPSWPHDDPPDHAFRVLRLAMGMDPERLDVDVAEPPSIASQAEMAAVLARLFPEEHAAELALREDVALRGSEGLWELAHSGRGGPGLGGLPSR